MRHFILVPLLGIASTLSVLPAQANDGPSRREQAAQAKAELDRKFTNEFVRTNIVVGRTTMDQVRSLYGEATSSSISSGHENWHYDKDQMQHAGTRGFGKLASRVWSAGRLVGMVPGMGAADRVGDAGSAGASAAYHAENLTESDKKYQYFAVVFDNNGKVMEYSLN